MTDGRIQASLEATVIPMWYAFCVEGGTAGGADDRWRCDGYGLRW